MECGGRAQTLIRHPRMPGQVSKFSRLEVPHFIAVYQDLEPGKGRRGRQLVSRDEAVAEVRASFERAETDEFTGRPVNSSPVRQCFP
jgi:inorganic pyrophosphatase